MTQPAGATGAAHNPGASLSGTPADGARAVGAEISCTAATATAAAAPFSQTLLALAAGIDTGVPALQGAGVATADAAAADPALAVTTADATNAASPPKGAIMLPKEWLLASTVTQPGTSTPELPAAQSADTKTTGTGASGDTRAFAGATRARPASTRQSAANGELKNTPKAASKTASKTKSVTPALPKDLLRALFVTDCALPAQAGAAQSRALGVDDDRRTGAADNDAVAGDANANQVSAAAIVPVPVPTQTQALDSGAALLAAVLQWLQPSRSGPNDASPSASAAKSGRQPAADPLSATGAATAALTAAAPTTAAVTVTATGTAIATATATSAQEPAAASSAGQPAFAQTGGAGQDMAVAGKGMAAAPLALALTGKPVSLRDADSQSTVRDSPRLPRAVADVNTTVDAMNMAAALRATSAANPAQAERSVAVPVHDRQWPAAVAAQVLILSNDKVQAATLRLSPEHLGPVEVHIDMQDANVNVNFTAAHAETRSALEQAMPQLRAVLAGAGLTLGQATVQQQTRRESQNSNSLPRAGSAADEAIEAPAGMARALGMIDEYV